MTLQNNKTPQKLFKILIKNLYLYELKVNFAFKSLSIKKPCRKFYGKVVNINQNQITQELMLIKELKKTMIFIEWLQPKKSLECDCRLNWITLDWFQLDYINNLPPMFIQLPCSTTMISLQRSYANPLANLSNESI